MKALLSWRLVAALVGAVVTGAPGCGEECPEGEIVCDGKCVDPSSDLKNCGSCGIDCDALGYKGVCINSVCGCPQCPTGLVRCGSGGCSACVSLASDDQNCGSCGRTCAPGTQCVKGDCVGSADGGSPS